MATTSKKKKDAPYVVSLTLGSETVEAKAADPVEAILALKPQKISARGHFTLSHEGKQSTLRRNVIMTKRAVRDRLYAFALGRSLTMLLK